MNALFGLGSSEDSTDAVSGEMGDAIAFSIPVRNAVGFGLCTKEELQKKLDELNKR